MAPGPLEHEVGVAEDWGLGRSRAVQAGAHAGLLTWTGETRGVRGSKRAKEVGPMCSGDRRGEGGVGVG